MTPTASDSDTADWLFIHYGDSLLRGSERCLLNVLQARSQAGRRQHTVLWCNQSSLADAAAPWVDEVVLTAFRLGPGFTQEPGGASYLRHWVGLVAQGLALARRRHTRLVICSGLAPCQWMVPVSLRLGLPLLAQLHTNYLAKSRVTSLVYAASHVMGVSVFCTRDLAADGFPASRLSVIHNGVQTPAVNTPREAMRSSLGIAPSTLLLASVGALVDWKRVDVLLSALESLHPMLRARVQLLVVGEGPRMAALQAQAAGQPVQFTGWRTDVGDLLNAADVIATGATREAFGLTIVEAAALGRPALAAAAGGLPEVVVHGHSGLLFESGCPLACADAIKRLLNEPGLLTRLGQASLARYVECFTVQHMGAQVLALGDRLVSEPSAGRIVRVIWLLRLATGATLLRLRGNRPS